MNRRIVQIIATVVTNHYVQGFLNATIYKGPFKNICHPGMQCYSCPSSVTACPIGALQNFLATTRETLSAGMFNIGLYVIGFFGVLGMIFGRLICGWVCPFGLLQDMLFKIPTPKYRIPLFLSYGKYFSLFVLAILLPLFLSFYSVSFTDAGGHFSILPTISANVTGDTFPWFCKTVCPSGTFEAGIPKVIQDPAVRGSLGVWFSLKWTLLVVFLLLMIVNHRAFCKIACPIGAIYGLFNKYSFYQLSVDKKKCTNCKLCKEVCPADLRVSETPNHPDCIRCLECVKVCRSHAIKRGFFKHESD